MALPYFNCGGGAVEFRLSDTMDVFKSEYYRLNVLLLWVIGLWPLDHGIFQQVQKVIISTSLLLIVLCQVEALRTSRQELNDFLMSLSYILILVGFLIKYDSYLLSHSIRKKLMSMIRNDWYAIRNPEERCILQQYAEKGKFHTKVFAMLLYLTAVTFSMFPFSAMILDVILPLNQSRSREYPMKITLYFDAKRYFVAGVLIVTVSAFIIGTTFVATEAISIQCLQHASALWEITSYRITKAFELSRQQNPAARQNAACNLGRGIQMHIQTLGFCKFMKLNFAQPYLLLLGLGVLSLSIHLFRFSQLLGTPGNLGEGAISLLICTAILAYMYYMNYVTQDVIDKSSDFFTGSYSSPWYEAPLPMQKLLLMILLKSMHAFTFDLFGIFNPSIEGFLLIARASVSYFMMLQSFQ